MIRHLAALCCVTIWASSLWAQDIVLPGEPSRAEIPDRTAEGERVRGIALYTTSAVRLGDQEIIVLYGFIVGQMDGGSSYFLWNDRLGVTCQGRTERQSDGSGLGGLSCDRGGAPIFVSDFGVVAEKYGKLRSTVSAVFRGVDGRPVAMVLRWQGRARFPDPQPLVDALQ